MGVFKVRVIGDKDMLGSFPDSFGAGVTHVLARYLQPATANDKVEIFASSALTMSDYTDAAAVNRKLSYLGTLSPVNVTVVVFGGGGFILDAAQAAGARDFLARAATALLASTPGGRIYGLVTDATQPQVYPERAARVEAIVSAMFTVFGANSDVLQIPSGSSTTKVKSIFPALPDSIARDSRGVAIVTSTPTRGASGTVTNEACESLQGLGAASCALPPPAQLPDDFFDEKFPEIRPGDVEMVLDPAKMGGGKKGLSKGNMALLGIAAVGAAMILFRRRGSF